MSGKLIDLIQRRIAHFRDFRFTAGHKELLDGLSNCEQPNVLELPGFQVATSSTDIKKLRQFGYYPYDAIQLKEAFGIKAVNQRCILLPASKLNYVSATFEAESISRQYQLPVIYKCSDAVLLYSQNQVAEDHRYERFCDIRAMFKRIHEQKQQIHILYPNIQMFHSEQLTALARLENPSNAFRVLDIGSGGGHGMVDFMVQHGLRGTYVGLDTQAFAMTIIEQRLMQYGESVIGQGVLGDANFINDPDLQATVQSALNGKPTHILCIGAIQQIIEEDPSKGADFLVNLANELAPGGYLYVSDDYYEPISHEEFRISEAIIVDNFKRGKQWKFSTCESTRPEGLISINEVLDSLRVCGLSPISIKSVPVDIRTEKHRQFLIIAQKSAKID